MICLTGMTNTFLRNSPMQGQASPCLVLRDPLDGVDLTWGKRDTGITMTRSGTCPEHKSSDPLRGPNSWQNSFGLKRLETPISTQQQTVHSSRNKRLGVTFFNQTKLFFNSRRNSNRSPELTNTLRWAGSMEPFLVCLFWLMEKDVMSGCWQPAPLEGVDGADSDWELSLVSNFWCGLVQCAHVIFWFLVRM